MDLVSLPDWFVGEIKHSKSLQRKCLSSPPLPFRRIPPQENCLPQLILAKVSVKLQRVFPSHLELPVSALTL